MKRQEKQQEYARQVADLDEQIERQRQIRRDLSHVQEQERTLEQKRRDLAAAVSLTDRNQALPSDAERSRTLSIAKACNTTIATPSSALPGTYPAPIPQDSGILPRQSKSAAKQEWHHQKEFEKVKNEHLDSLMEMIGLEDVKKTVLTIKAKVDTAIRQNTDLNEERFGVALLGNPGTGKPE